MGTDSKNMVSTVIGAIDEHTYKMLRFTLYVSIIFTAFICSSVLVQKIYKTPYLNTNNPESVPAAYDYFENPFAIPLFSGFFGLAYGFFMYEIFQHNNEYRTEQNNSYQKQFIKLSAVQVIIHLVIQIAIILTSFTTMNLINCCNLLAVVLFAVFFGQATGKYQVQKRHVFVAIVITLGIIMFNLFKQNDKANSADKQFTLWTALLVVALLFIEGYRPELVAQIREKYSPPPSLVYYQVSKYGFLFMLISAAVSTYLFKLATFLWEHDRLALDLTLVAILDTIGTVFIYRIIVLHKQHVVPMVCTIRKLMTSVVNIWYFKHTVVAMQWVGLVVVVAAIAFELYVSYIEKMQKFNQVETEEPYVAQV